MGKERVPARIGRPARIEGEKHTKEKIFEAAINLFAKLGFDRTSIRRIARSLGLTESAIYRHFPGKESILEAIFAYAENLIYTPLPIEQGQGEYAGQSIFRGLLLPLPEVVKAMPIVANIVRIMYAEMHHNEKIRRYFQQTYVEKAEAYIEVLFNKQMESGAIRPCDTRTLSRVFNAFRSEWAFRNYIMGNKKTPDIEGLKMDLEGPIRFFEQYWIPEGERK